MSRYLLVEDVAAQLGCSVRSIHERTRLGDIPCRRPPGMRRWLFTQDELDAWINGAQLEVLEGPRGGRVVRPVDKDGR